MKKRSKLILSALLLLISCSLFFALYEGYGNSYSEKQRKLFNQRQEIHHGALLPDIFDRIKDEINDFLGLELDTPDEKIESRHQLLLKQTQTLQEHSGPRLDFSINENPDIHSLPLSGLTREELITLADEYNNADACIQLFSHVSLSSFHSYHFRKKWLEKAISLKRPGAVFLLNALEEFYRMPFDSSKRNSADWFPNIEGFDEFHQLVNNGDELLLMAALTVNPFVSFNWIILDSAFWLEQLQRLEKEAEHGNVNAQKTLATIYVNAVYSWNFPDFIEEPAIGHWMKQAGESGDLDAMALWMRSKVLYTHPCSKEDWLRFFNYAKRLAAAGYADFHGYIYISGDPWFNDSLHLEGSGISAITRYYHPEDTRGFIHRCGLSLIKRGDIVPFVSSNKLDNNKELALLYLEKIRKIEPGILYYFDSGKNIIKENKDPEVLQLYSDIVVENADAGDPLFLKLAFDFFSSDEYSSRDDSKACAYFEKLWSDLYRKKKYDHIHMAFEFKAGFETMPYAIILYLNPESPAYNPAKASTLIDELNDLIDSDQIYDGYQLYTKLLLGFKYERGIGVDIDKIKAEKLYSEAKELDNTHDLIELCELLSIDYETIP